MKRLQVFYTKNCEGLLSAVSDAIYEFYRLKTFKNTQLDIISSAYNSERKQFYAQPLLDHLLRVKEEEFALWLVDRDMYTDERDFIFGYAVHGLGAVLSVYHLRSEELVRKEAVHEVGHVLGLKHCDGRCLMAYSGSVEEAQRKPFRLCERCADSVKVI